MFRRNTRKSTVHQNRRNIIPREVAERRKRNRVILKSILAGVVTVDVILALLLVYVLFLHMPYFNLQQVDVVGNRHLSKDEVVEASEIERGINLLTVSLPGIAERLRRHPWIRSASVYRRFPGRLIIEIHERSPQAILAAGKLFFVDEQGEPFTRVLPGDPISYPLFTGVTKQELTERSAEVRELMKRGRNMLDLLERLEIGLKAGEVSEVRVDPDAGLTLITRDGLTLILGNGDYESKLQRFDRLKRYLTSRGAWTNARIIDLDFEDRALVRPVGAHGQG